MILSIVFPRSRNNRKRKEEERKEGPKKRKKNERKREHTTPEDSPEKVGRHLGLPTPAPTLKIRKT